MANEALRHQIMGILIEEGQDILDIAKQAESDILEAVKKITDDEDENIRGAKLLGLSLAAIEFEDMFD